MARLREFDRDKVLDRAMRVFWRKGFGATSVEDLVKATGINRASMYAAFGDKRALFLAAVDRYLERVNADRLHALRSTPSARAAIRGFFLDAIEFSLGEGRRLGCLLTNSAVEMSPQDRAVAEKIGGAFGRVETAFRDAVRRGQEAGEINPGKDARALARFFLMTLQGLRVLSRGRSNRAALEDAVTVALGALD